MGRIQLLRELLIRHKIDSYIIPSSDEWQNEYSSKVRLAFISGFSGSNGVLIITQKNLILYTDSRYTAQAKIELSNEYTTLDMYKQEDCGFMKICEGCTIGYDPMILTQKEVEYYEKIGAEFNFNLLAIDENLVDILMVDNTVNVVEISGEDASVLCKKIINALPQYFPNAEVNEKYIEDVKYNYNLAATVDEKYCGMISIEWNYEANANIYWLGIWPDIEGMKIGTRLINHIENIAITQGIKTLTVETLSLSENDTNYLSIYNFYKKCGFNKLFTIKPAGYNHEMAYMVKSDLSSKSQQNDHASEVLILPHSITGESVDEKFNRLATFFPKNSEYLILTCPDSICWLLNLRGKDIQYNMSILSYAIISRNEINFFVNISSISSIEQNNKNIFKLENYNLNEILQLKNYHINIKPISIFKQFLLENKHQNFALDRNKSSAWIIQNLLYTEHIIDPTVKMRSVKNLTELEGIKLAHLYDGVAICKFWFWLYVSLKSGNKIDESSAAAKLSEFRKQNEFFLCESFATISAYGSNGAIVHYHPKENTCRAIPSQGCDYIYLLDSGGQYTTAGTTDITRVFDLGKIFGVNKYEHKKAYTLILKGHINLARAIFPVGTTGSQLDVLTRYNLWQNGIDYGHGTGHGVGHFLSVHEGPHAISSRNQAPLEENMILSIEPGYYKEGSFGMRIENLYCVKKASKFEGFLQFQLLTMVPIETSLVDFNLLSADEIDWLKTHNKITLEAIKNYLTSDEVEFLVSNSKVTSSI